MDNSIIDTILSHFQEAQAIYLFGTHGAENERPDSDVDVALLLPPEKAKQTGPLTLSEAWFEFESTMGKTVDLVNLRLAPRVLQKEVIAEDRRICAGDENAAEEFETLTISFFIRNWIFQS